MDSQNMNTHVFREYDIRGVFSRDLTSFLVLRFEAFSPERLDESRREIETILYGLLDSTTQAAMPVLCS